MSEVFDLDAPAKQTVFAQLMACSQPSIAQHLDKGRLTRGGTYRQWLGEYAEHLRNEAAGRGGSLQEELAAAKIEESRIRSASTRLDYQMKINALVPSEFAAQNLRDWAAQANREYLAGIRDFAAEIQSIHKIEIDPELTTKHAGAIIRRIADHAGKLATGLAGGS